MQNDAISLIALSEDMASALQQLQLPDSEENAEPADEGRQLLRRLNNLPSAEMPLEDWLEAAPQEALPKASNLSQLVKIYIRKLKRARKKRPDILRDDA